MTRRASLARLAGLTTLWLGVELLERVAYRAGVDTGRAVVRDDLAWLNAHRSPEDDDGTSCLVHGADSCDCEAVVIPIIREPDDLEAFDASDVLRAHGIGWSAS